jgi:hypothetical protein
LLSIIFVPYLPEDRMASSSNLHISNDLSGWQDNC